MFPANKFLQDFVKMRQSLHNIPKVSPLSSKKEEPKMKPSSLSVATIIEKKPPVKEVVEFFKMKNTLV
jgi:hypothetical protein